MGGNALGRLTFRFGKAAARVRTMADIAWDPSDPASIERYAKRLEGMTFREVLDLGIVPEGVVREYNNRRYKGGMGTLIEERFFGYKANSDQEPDFPEAGVELKASCFDVKKNGDYSAGERLVLTMIPMDGPIADDFFASHVWRKSEKILLVYYERDRGIDGYDQVIRYVKLITPSEEDLKIIREDYDKIASLVKAGKADELSEGMTSYLGACTKGASEATMWVDQFYPPHTPAKKRAFCFKRSYMDYLLHSAMMPGQQPAEPIVPSADVLDEMTFEEYVLSLLQPHFGKTDRALCDMLGLEYTGNKAQWVRIVYSLLGLRGERAEEFEKANVSVRTVRVEERGAIVESLSLDTFKFCDIANQEWDDSALKAYFEETRFLFVSFLKTSEGLRLEGARFWSMPMQDIEGPLRDCWERTKEVVSRGVELEITIRKDGEVVIKNNLPKKTDKGSIAHVRPHTSKRAYKLENGFEIGDIERDGDELPDGRIMTQQSFWLNNTYVYGIVSLSGDHEGDGEIS